MGIATPLLCCCKITGRLDEAKAWFFKWEGAVVGGLFLSSVAALGVRLYVIERLDDIERCVSPMLSATARHVPE